MQASPRWKGWRPALRVLGLIIASAVVAIPLAFVVAMSLTPLLWRLEPVLGLELAGHSGPSEWIFWTIFALLTVVLSVILLRVTRARAAAVSYSAPPRTDRPI